MKLNRSCFSRCRSRSVSLIAALIMLVSLGAATASCSEEWEERWNRRQPPEAVMDTLGIEPGMVVAEIGAGKGRYVVHIAARVGSTGTVYAEDIDAQALEYVKFRCARDRIGNIKTILGGVTDPKLPPGSCDFVYCINTYHHIEKPVPLLRNTIPALKPSGLLVVIEHSPDKVEEKDFGSHCTPPDSVVFHARTAGFEFVRRHSFLELDEMYVFRVMQPDKK